MPDYDAAAALLVTDLQNDFADPRGSLYVAGADQLLTVVNREIEAAGVAGSLVVYTQDWHPPATPHFARDGGNWPIHCVAGSWGAEFLPGLVVAGPVVRKGTGGEDGYSGFTVRDPATGHESSTELRTVLGKHGVKRLVVVGVATDYCVRETALDALALGLAVDVPSGSVRAVDVRPGDGERALSELAAAGARVLP